MISAKEKALKKIKTVLLHHWTQVKKVAIETSFLDLLSMGMDTAVVASYFIFMAIFSRVLASSFSRLDELIVEYMQQPQILLQGAVVMRSVGLMLLSYLCFVAAYSLLNGFLWIKLMGRKPSFYLIWGFLKQNGVFALVFLAVIYGVRMLFVDPVWQIIDFLFIVVSVAVLGLMHIRLLDGNEKRPIRLVFTTYGFFFRNLKKLIIPGIVMLAIFNIIVMSTVVFGAVSQYFEYFMTLVFSLFAISVIRRYLIIVVRSWKQ